MTNVVQTEIYNCNNAQPNIRFLVSRTNRRMFFGFMFSVSMSGDEFYAFTRIQGYMIRAITDILCLLWLISMNNRIRFTMKNFIFASSLRFILTILFHYDPVFNKE